MTVYTGERQATPLETLWGLWNRLEAMGAKVHRIPFNPHAWHDARIRPLAAVARERLRVLEAHEAATLWAELTHHHPEELDPPWT